MSDRGTVSYPFWRPTLAAGVSGEARKEARGGKR